MKSTLLVYKPAGTTPLQIIEKVRAKLPELSETKISMAGRLDPMAEGLLLLLIGDENKKRKDYEQLDKEYSFSVLVGIATDSYDGLGLIKTIHEPPSLSPDKIQNIILSFTGDQQQSYPPFSSKPFQGKPLYYWSRIKKIDESILPKKQVTIHSLDLTSSRMIPLSELVENICNRISTVHGEFRQEEITSQWKNILTQYKDASFPLYNFTIRCTSGTYVRAIAHELGKQLKTGAFAYSIQRTKIGNYTLSDVDHSLV